MTIPTNEIEDEVPGDEEQPIRVWTVHFETKVHVDVPVRARTESEACDAAWQAAETYLQHALSYIEAVDDGHVTADASLDGVGADYATIEV